MDDNKNHLDYSKKTTEERLEHVANIIEKDNVQSYERKRINAMSDYILFSNDAKTAKKEKYKEYPITARNRDATINKRQTSLESVVDSLESTPLSIYQLINSDRDLFLDVRDTITEEMIQSNPELKALYSIIENLQKQLDSATGKDRFSLKKQIIETWQQMYLVRANNNPARVLSHALDMRNMELPENIFFGKDGLPHSDGIVSFYNPTHVSFLLEYYMAVLHECKDDMNCDMRWMLLDFEYLIRETFKNNPKRMRLCLMKMLGYTNDEIDSAFQKYYGETHTKQYYSTVWRNTIPKAIVHTAQKKYTLWYWRDSKNKMIWKKCAKCGEWKPAHPLFFRKNSSSNDGLYSVCRDCSHKKVK